VGIGISGTLKASTRMRDMKGEKDFGRKRSLRNVDDMNGAWRENFKKVKRLIKKQLKVKFESN
jgi:hypothetical protein